MKPPMPHLLFKGYSSVAATIQQSAALCESVNSELQPYMTGYKKGDCFSSDSAGTIDTEANLLVPSKHFDVKEQKFASALGKSSSHDSSPEKGQSFGLSSEGGSPES